MIGFDNWLKQEREREMEEECSLRQGNCSDCSFQEDCSEDEILRSLDEW